MLSKQETKGLARWKPLLILPLALVFVLAFAESRTVVVRDGQEAVQAKPADVGVPVEEPTEDEMMKALKEDWFKLQELKQKNTEDLEFLKQKLEGTTDPGDKEKLMSKIKDQEIFSLQLGAKERMLQMKKLELALNKETDPEKKAQLEEKLKQLQIESEEYMKKLQAAGGKIIKLKEKKAEQR